MTFTVGRSGGVSPLASGVLSPNVQDEDGGDKNQAHDQDWDWTAETRVRRSEGKLKWSLVVTLSGHLHFKSWRVLGVESPHTSAATGRGSSGSSGASASSWLAGSDSAGAWSWR